MGITVCPIKDLRVLSHDIVASMFFMLENYQHSKLLINSLF